MTLNPLKWFQWGKVALNEKAVVEKAVEEAKKPSADGLKPSWKTGEFWVGPAVVQLALAWEGLHGLIDGKVWAIGTVAIAAVTFLARTWLKKHDLVAKAVHDRNFSELEPVVSDLKDDLPKIVEVFKLLKAGDHDGAAKAAGDLKAAA